MSSNFFVYVIESPSAPDIYHGRGEGEVLIQLLKLSGTASALRRTINRDAFYTSLQVGLNDEIGKFAPARPLLHISCHGSNEGIQLSSGDQVTWAELASLITPINKALGGQLVIAMSCCEGYSGIQMAMTTEDGPLPFLALVGSTGKPTWADSAIAFSAFYHLLNKNIHVRDAVQAMNTASGCNDFRVQWAEQSKQGFLDYVKQQYNPSEVRQKLQDNANLQPPNDLAKRIQLENNCQPGQNGPTI